MKLVIAEKPMRPHVTSHVRYVEKKSVKLHVFRSVEMDIP